MEESFITLKEVPISNNCPECFNNTGLKILFKQKFVETKFYKSITDSIVHEIICENCNTIIYPVRYTHDIESVVEYQTRALSPKKPSTYFKKITWVYVGSAALVLIAIVTIVIFTIN